MKRTNLSLLLALSTLLIVIVASFSEADVAASTNSHALFESDGSAVSLALDDMGYTVFWSRYDGCPGGEFPSTCKIRYKGVDSAYDWSVFNNAGGPGSDDLASNIAADSEYVYWVSNGGEILRIDHYGSSSPDTVATKESLSTYGQIAVDDNYVYWTENVSSTGKLFRAPKTGGARQFMVGSSDSDLRQLKADGQGGVFFIAEYVYNSICCDDTLHRVTPDGAGGFDTDVGGSPIVVQVQNYTTDDTHVYWATTASSSLNLHLRKAPLSNLSSESIVQDIDDTGSPVVRGIAVDTTNLYWHEYRSPSGGPINRLPLAGGAVDPMTENIEQSGDLESNGRHLYWVDAADIYRVPIDVPPTTLDLVGDDLQLEVVQVIQSQSHDVPLVEGKTTFVRAFGRIGSSSEGLTEFDLWPPVLLHGSRDGTPLPESPLRPISPPPLRDDAVDRTSLDNTFLFQLPDSWAEGTIDLRADLNPGHARTETNYANNDAQRTVTFEPTQSVCLDFLPVLTTDGPSQSGRNESALLHIARAKSMLPLSDLGGVFRGGSLRTKPVTGEPYNMNEDDDPDELMFHLTMELMLSSPPSHCGDRRTIRTVMVPDAARFGLSNGAAPIIYFLEHFGGPDVNYPRGGNAGLAHELGHQFGRAHVACPVSGPNAPTGTDSAYPYNTCRIDDTNNHVGFDSITQQLIVPLDSDTPSDVMSYGPTPNWPSDYTYEGMFNNLDPSASLAPVQPAAQPQNGDSLLVAGYIPEVGEPVLNHAYELSGASLSEASADIASTTVISTAFELRLFDSSDTLLDAYPLNVNVVEGEVEADTGFITFANLVAPDPDLATIRVVEVGTGSLASQSAGAASPQITINSPTPGATFSDHMTVTWTASDPDGDALMHQVRYSNDNGATWTSLGQTAATAQIVDTSTLPGGNQSLIQIISSDGLHSSAAMAGPFTVANHAPQVVIQANDYHVLNANVTASAAQNQAVVLRGLAHDPEDGDLSGSALQWQISGPVSRSGTGTEWTLTNLPPGTYDVQLQASDTGGQIGSTSTTLTISPKRIFDGSAPSLDGHCDDPAYAADQDSITLPYDDGSRAEVRFVHTADYLFACFSGLMLHPGDTFEQVKLEFDLDNSMGSTQQSDDLIFWAGKDAWFQTGSGDGAGGESTDSVPQGLLGAVHTADISWQVELRIDADVLGGWNKLVGMRLAHELQAGAGLEQDWPDQVQDNVPGTWGRTAFGQLGQSITFPALSNHRFDQAPVDLGATASSGLPITYTSLTPGVCTVEVGAVHFTGLGTCTVRASQPGDATYAAASNVSRSFEVLAGNQTIQFPALPNRSLDASPFRVTALATSALPVTFSSSTPGVCSVSGNQVTLLSLGQCTIAASQPGNANYAAAPDVSRTFNVVEQQHALYLPAVVRH